MNTVSPNNTSQSKAKLFFVVLACAILVLYFFMRNGAESNKPKQQERQENNSGVETDSLKRLENYSKSGTIWGMSPFGSGNPIVEANTKKPVFKKPITEWKSRSVTLQDGRTLYYEFGNGNPREVALTTEDMKLKTRNCGTSSDPNNTGYLCKDYDGYVTPEVEKYLLAALSDPNWEPLFTKCEEHLRYGEDSLNYPVPPAYTSPYSSNNLTYDIVAYTDFFDINNWMSIDAEGRKHLDEMKVINLQDFIQKKTKRWFEQTEYPMSIRNDAIIGPKEFTNGIDCVDNYGGRILDNLSMAQRYDLSAQQNRAPIEEKVQNNQ